MLGLARSDAPVSGSVAERDRVQSLEAQADKSTPASGSALAAPLQGATDSSAPRAQKISATLTVEVSDSDGVSRAAQGALDLTRSLGGFVVSSSVATGDEGSASITLRVPVDRVQEAIAGLSGLGRIVAQQVTVEDRQESIDALSATQPVASVADRARQRAARHRITRRRDASEARSPPEEPPDGSPRRAGEPRRAPLRGPPVDDSADGRDARRVRRRRTTLSHRPRDRRIAEHPGLGSRDRPRHAHRPRALRTRRRSPPGSAAGSTAGTRTSGCSH